MAKLGINKDSQKKINRGLILKLIATGQCNSRVGLAHKTGLTKPAVSQIVSELMKTDYLMETSIETTMERGRNPVKITISSNAPRYAGVLIKRGYCEAVVCDMQMNIQKEARIESEWKNAAELMDGVYCVLDRVLEDRKGIHAIGVACIGPVDVKEGKILRPFHFNGIENVEVTRLLEERYQLPVAFDHDNQSAVFVEYLYGSGKGFEDILLIGIDQGVGCGILINGQRIHSSTGYTPEIGHVSVEHDGERCVCGNYGCLEMYTNSTVLLKKFHRITRKALSYEECCGMADHPQMDAIIKEAVLHLDDAIISTLNILNSQVIILGSDCCYWPEKYILMMEEEINHKKMGNKDVRIPVKKAKFLQKSQLLGAACNAINQVFQGELL